MLRPKSAISQRRVAAVVAPLALVLSMTASHQAMAACSASAVTGIILDCAGDVTISSAVSNTTGTATPRIAIRLTDVTNLTNRAAISSSVTAGTLSTTNVNYGVYGIWGQVGGSAPTGPNNATEFSVNNYGTISTLHAGRGLVASVYAQGDVENFTVNNYGTISVERGTQQIASISAAGAVTVNPNGNAALQGTLGIAAGIYNNEEEVEAEIINNYGTIQAKGQLTAGIYSRANGLLIQNYGTIEAVAEAGIVNAAIATYDGRIQGDGPEGAATPTHRVVTYGKTFLDNYGTINGDIQVIEQTNLSFMGAKLGGIDLALTAQNERRDSEIFNSGTINGNIYLGLGNHVFTNTAEGKITGDIVVDQRRANNPPAANALPFSISVAERPVVGAGDDDDDDDDNGVKGGYSSYADFIAANPYHTFVFDNAAALNGNVTVFTSLAGTPSSISLQPHITGTGAGSNANDPSKESGYIAGTLAIGEGTWTGGVTTSKIASTTTLKPVIDYVVNDGNWYLVAQTLVGSELPTIINDSFLVNWQALKNASGSLVIGASVADASIVSGLSKPGVDTLNSLMHYNGNDGAVGALGGAVQSLSDENDVRRAGEQLKPETNFATQQAAFTLNTLTGNYIDNRLNGVGVTAPGAANFASPYKLGAARTASPEGRMSLGLGNDDGRMNIGANDGRMDAGIYDDDTDPRQRGYSTALWGQAFGAGLDQNELANVDGYRTHIYGAMAGFDNWISSNTRLGIAGGYGNTKISGTGDTPRNETGIDSYFGTIYGAYKGSGWYLSTRAGYAWHDYSTTRFVTVPVNDVATGGHSGNQYSASAEIGTPLHDRLSGATLTPVASLSWSRLDQSAYTEASANGAGLSIASQENTSLASGLGAKALLPIAEDTLLEGRAIWYHEFEDTNQQVTAAFADGPSFLASGPNVGRDTAALGVGLFAYAATGVSFQLNYDALLRQDFVGHMGSSRLNVEF